MKRIFSTVAVCFFSCIVQAQWQTSGSNIYNTNAGNVGIGTTTPGVKLDVNGDARSTRFVSSALTLNGTDVFTYDNKTAYHYGLSWAPDTWNANGPTAWLSGFAGIKFFVSGQPKMAINGSGNVGIGTTNPSNLLQIADGADDATKYGTVQIIRAANPNDNRFHLCFIRNGQMFSGIGYVNGTNTLGIWGGNNTSATPIMAFLQNQSVGIGTANPGPYKLAVEGSIGARKITVTQANPWADYVFDSSYDLKPLSEVERFIKTNKHLPEVPSAAEVQKEGIDLGSNQTKLLQKIEELTLYLIEQNKKMEVQEKKLQSLEQEIKILRTTHRRN